jgi:hypothetical protein
MSGCWWRTQRGEVEVMSTRAVSNTVLLGSWLLLWFVVLRLVRNGGASGS